MVPHRPQAQPACSVGKLTLKRSSGNFPAAFREAGAVETSTMIVSNADALLTVPADRRDKITCSEESTIIIITRQYTLCSYLERMATVQDLVSAALSPPMQCASPTAAPATWRSPASFRSWVTISNTWAMPVAPTG